MGKPSGHSAIPIQQSRGRESAKLKIGRSTSLAKFEKLTATLDYDDDDGGAWNFETKDSCEDGTVHALEAAGGTPH